MNKKFQLIECNDDDVVSFNSNLVKFVNFKSDLEKEFWQKRRYLLTEENAHLHSSGKTRMSYLTNTSFGECDLTINLSSPKEGKECEILRLGSKTWQKGKLRTQAFIGFFSNTTEKAKIQFILEFSPDEPEIIEPESPLDDIRRMINEVST